jgi:mannitol/fructose-specific phosphotransferase system IIA component (Ntr-type)
MTFKDFISEDNVVLNRDFDTWQDAIRFAGDLLVRSGCINQQYCEDMIDTVKTHGPYIVIMPGVALAHARPNGNVFKNQIALVSMPKGVVFGSTNNDPVHYLFAVAACTDKEHMTLFQTLAKFIAEEKNMKALQKAECFADIEF